MGLDKSKRVENKSPNQAKKAGLQVRYLEITADQAEQRIDNFLINQLPGVPKTRIYRMLRKGEVRVNKGRVKPLYKINENDRIRIPPVSLAEQPKPVDFATGKLDWLEKAILYEDDGLLVLNKPTGLAVHGGSGVSWGVIEAIRALRPKVESLELVHRLDKATSGCLLIAKKRSKLRQLHALLRNGDMAKTYTGLVMGRWPGSLAKVEQPLLKIEKGGESIVVVDPQGKSARTFYNRLEEFPQATLMEIHLDTGRTHQIRVHAAWSGHPLAGDEKYGDAEFNEQMRQLGLNRMFLHATSLKFRLPDEQTDSLYQAPQPKDLVELLDNLRSGSG